MVSDTSAGEPVRGEANRVKQLEADLREARAEVTALRAIANQRFDYGELLRERNEARAEVKRWKGLADEFAWHKVWCKTYIHEMGPSLDPAPACTCGYDEAIKGEQPRLATGAERDAALQVARELAAAALAYCPGCRDSIAIHEGMHNHPVHGVMMCFLGPRQRLVLARLRELDAGAVEA